jgi:hypothetical protein
LTLPLVAVQFDIAGPSGSEDFGKSVTVLPNGNFVVTDPSYDAPGPVLDVGAAYLYSPGGALLSTLTGTKVGDRVGFGGAIVLTNGDFVVRSPSWSNGAVASAGAVTWGSRSKGISGAVSAANSLVGSSAGDRVGQSAVTALDNGNYVVSSSSWDHGSTVDAGAVTWCNGTLGGSGVVSAANSLVGLTANDQVGSGGVVRLSNGNYVVCSPLWDNGAVANAGAVTWGSGTTGVRGVVTAANSLIGSTAADGIGNGGSVTPLSNGNYVVTSPLWDNGVANAAGAVTLGNGTTGIAGPISAANSLVGSTAGDQVGGAGTSALDNGNYVVASPAWDNGAVVDAGAATWGDGTTGICGEVTAGNSLVGSKANDQVAKTRVTALRSGHYVVVSPFRDNGTLVDAGAVTWGDGTAGVSGLPGAANSLVGSKANDSVGSGGVTALNNGHYVVSSPSWDDASIANAGAATWGNGRSGISGAISSGNSLVGGAANCYVGANAAALTNGNYVVISPSWPNGNITAAGAVTWCNGGAGTSGTVSVANSLVGSKNSDNVGEDGVVALANGNYVVRSANCDLGAILNIGAVTWGDGRSGIAGVVSEANSLVGNTLNDNVGSRDVIALSNGNYVVNSPSWDNGAVANAGAVTWGSGTTGVRGVITAANSLVGMLTNDGVGDGGVGQSVFSLSDGRYAVRSTVWDNGAMTDVGAATLGDGAAGTTNGAVSGFNSIQGTVVGYGSSLAVAYDAGRGQLVVGCRGGNLVSLFTYGAGNPEIAIEQPAATELANGGSRHFGSVAIHDASSLTFTIRNLGNAALTGLAITIDGSDREMFVLTDEPAAPLAGPEGATTFGVRFVPTSGGLRTAVLHLASNDDDEGSFDIGLTGNGVWSISAWRQANFGSSDNSGDGADLNDYDHDGIPNLAEYAFDLNPKANSAGLLPQGGLSGGAYVISFPQVVGVQSITYGAEWSTTLAGGWTEVADTGGNGGHSFSIPQGTHERLFMRLVVRLNP